MEKLHLAAQKITRTETISEVLIEALNLVSTLVNCNSGVFFLFDP